MKIYTKTGDQGETGLFFGGRVPKSDARCEAYGEADSVVSYMGLARALCLDEGNKEILLHVQNRMFTVGAELATLPENYEKLTDYYHTIDSDMVLELEKYIDKLLRISFNSRRKMLRNTLNSILSNEEINELSESSKVCFNLRPQDISIDQWIKLAENCIKIKK